MSSTAESRAETVGGMLGLLCAFCTAGFLLLFREATDHAQRSTVVFAMLFWAALLNSLLVVTRIRTTPMPNRTWVVSALVLGVLSIGGNICLAAALPLLGAGVTSTIMQLQVFFVALGAWAVLGERVGLALFFGALVAATGFAYFGLAGTSAQSLSALGLLMALLTVVCFASMIVWTRKVIHGLDPVALNAGRLWLAAAATLFFPGVLGELQTMSAQAWLLAFGAALSGPVVSRLAIMYSLRYISAAKTKLWGMLSPVFAFLLVFLVYGTAPSAREFVGCSLIVLGVLVPSLYRLRKISVSV